MTVQDKLISVIVPVYNIEAYLPHCLDCISRQTYRNLEIILVDDASTDNSGKLCDEFASKDSRARVIRHSGNRGLWAARNTGQDVAHGEYLWFPDGDDYFHFDIVRVLYEAIAKRPECDIAMVEYKATGLKDEDTNCPVLSIVYEELSQSAFFASVATGQEGVIWNKLYKREVLESIRSKPYPRSQDLDFNLQVSMQLNCAVRVCSCLYYWVKRPNSLMRMPGVGALYCACHATIFYTNYLSLPQSLKAEGYMLLQQLYYRVIQWKELVWDSDDNKIVFQKCRLYVKRTLGAYLMAHRINPAERIICMLLVLHPKFVHHCSVVKDAGNKKGLARFRYGLSVFLLRFAYL